MIAFNGLRPLVVIWLFSTKIIIDLAYAELCPDKTRPHPVHKNVYYKCTNTPSGRNIWIMIQCNGNLRYQQHLGKCIPVEKHPWHTSDEMLEESTIKNPQISTQYLLNSDQSNWPLFNRPANHLESNDEKQVAHEDFSNKPDYSTTNDNAELISDFEDITNIKDNLDIGLPEIMNDAEGGNFTPDLNSTNKHKFSRIDPIFVAQLQRLSQLIDGLRRATPTVNNNHQSELRPHELNAFLAHFNIKNQLNSLSSDKESTQIQRPWNTGMIVDHLGRREQLKMPNSPHRTKYIINNILSDQYIQTLSPLATNTSSEIQHMPQQTFASTYMNKNPNLHAHQEDNVPDFSEEHQSTILELTQQLINSEHVPTIISKPTIYQFPDAPAHFTTADTDSNRPIHQHTQNNYNHHTPIKVSSLKEQMTPYFDQKESHFMLETKPKPGIIYNNAMPLKVIENGLPNKNFVGSYTSQWIKYKPLHEYKQQISNKTEQIQATELQTLNKSDLLQEYFIPAQHLNDANVNNIFQSSKQPPLNQIMVHHHLMENKKPLPWFPTPIDHQRIQIYPNAQSGQSLEVENKYERITSDMPNTSLNYELTTSTSTPTTTEPPRKSIKPNLQIVYEPLEVSTSPAVTTDSELISNHKLLEALKPALLQASNTNHQQLLNIGGNYISADIFFKAMTALLAPNTTLENKIQLITCAPGVRQPNITDCTRYFVCSRHSARVLSYSCPPYTAFNSIERICDAQTYSSCKVSKTEVENSKIIKRKPQISDKAQIYGQSLQKKTKIKPTKFSEALTTPSIPPITRRPPITKIKKPRRTTTTVKPSTTAKPIVAIKRYKYYCKEGDKVADRTSSYKYYVCYKNSKGQMKGLHMTCSKGLLFCAKTAMCAMPTKCH